MKHFINFDDFDKHQIATIIDNAIVLKTEYKNGVINKSLEHKTLAMIFDKSSTRTRVSFEAGMTQLGGHSIFLSSNDTQLGRGEIISDSATVISSMVDFIMLRVSSHDDISEFAKNSSIPVINALSDESHPCQLLADLMTFKELKGDIAGKTVCWIGDGNNVTNTYAQAAKIFDFQLNIASPKGYGIADKFKNKNTAFFDSKLDACRDVDLIVTDVWSSMGQEVEANIRAAAFKDYQVDDSCMEVAKDDALFMHCLPTHREEEVSSSVIDGSQSVVFLEAENRLHAQKSLLLFLNDS